MLTRTPTTLALLLAAGLMALLTTACSDSKAKFNAMDVTGAPWGQGFSLPDLSGKTTTQADFPGKITAVFFGFMYCPDACPTHLTRMAEVRRLTSFDQGIVGLRGNAEQTQAVARDFRVFFKKVDTRDSARDPKAYTIDHTTFTYVFDGQGRMRLVVPHDLPAEKIASDIRHLIGR
jgi:protein SCO1/2